jgi:aminoglycoside phosphotransferase (APT) family kinase protein
MGPTKMHADEIHTDIALVRRLLARQFPQWADLKIELVASYGTDHDIYRLGDHLAARLPRIYQHVRHLLLRRPRPREWQLEVRQRGPRSALHAS